MHRDMVSISTVQLLTLAMSEGLIIYLVLQGELPKGLERVSDPETHAFIRKCIDSDPATRPEARRLLAEHWFDEVRPRSGGLTSSSSGVAGSQQLQRTSWPCVSAPMASTTAATSSSSSGYYRSMGLSSPQPSQQQQQVLGGSGVDGCAGGSNAHGSSSSSYYSTLGVSPQQHQEEQEQATASGSSCRSDSSGSESSGAGREGRGGNVSPPSRGAGGVEGAPAAAAEGADLELSANALAAPAIPPGTATAAAVTDAVAPATRTGEAATAATAITAAALTSAASSPAAAAMSSSGEQVPPGPSLLVVVAPRGKDEGAATSVNGDTSEEMMSPFATCSGISFEEEEEQETAALPRWPPPQVPETAAGAAALAAADGASSSSSGAGSQQQCSTSSSSSPGDESGGHQTPATWQFPVGVSMSAGATDGDIRPQRSSYDSVCPAADAAHDWGGRQKDSQVGVAAAAAAVAAAGPGVWGSWDGAMGLQERAVEGLGGGGGLRVTVSSTGTSSHLDDMTEEDVLWDEAEDESEEVSGGRPGDNSPEAAVCFVENVFVGSVPCNLLRTKPWRDELLLTHVLGYEVPFQSVPSGHMP